MMDQKNVTFSRKKKKSKQANPEIRITRQGLLSSYLKYAQ